MCISNKLPGEADAVGPGSHTVRAAAPEDSRQVPLLCTGAGSWGGVSFRKSVCVYVCMHMYTCLSDREDVKCSLCAF